MSDCRGEYLLEGDHRVSSVHRVTSITSRERRAFTLLLFPTPIIRTPPCQLIGTMRQRTERGSRQTFTCETTLFVHRRPLRLCQIFRFLFDYNLVKLSWTFYFTRRWNFTCEISFISCLRMLYLRISV